MILKKPNFFNLSLKILPLISKRKWSWLCYLIISLNIKKMNSKVSDSKILIIKKEIFNEDILLSVGKFSNIEIYGIPRALIKSVPTILIFLTQK